MKLFRYYLLASVLSITTISTAQDNGLQFDGVDDYVSFASDPVFNSTKTFEAWLYPTSTTGFKTISEWTDGTGNIIQFYIRDGRLELWEDDGFNGGSVSGTGAINNNQWTHVAFVQSASGYLFYINGVSEDVGFPTGSAGATPIFNLGSKLSGTEYYEGILDEVRVWDVELDQTTIQNQMYFALTGAEANLIAYYQFNETSGTVLPDLTSNVFDGVLLNGIANTPPADGVTNGPLWVASSALPEPYIVTNTNNSDVGSLRWCIDNANTFAGANTITFNIPSGSIINIDSELQLTDNGTTILGDINGDSQPDITIDGGNVGINGFEVLSSDNVILNLNIVDFPAGGAAIYIYGITATNNLVAGCYIGTDLTGFSGSPSPNFYGIRIDTDASNNTIGDNTEGINVISGNTYGIYIESGNDNRIYASHVGMDISGGNAIANLGPGIYLLDAVNTVIGNTTEGNLISGNGGSGIEIDNSTGTIVSNNYIGTDITGTVDMGNGDDGIVITGNSTGTTIGNGVAGGGNVISGNSNQGLDIGSSGVTVLGNIVGLDASGTSSIPNTSIGILTGVGTTGISIGDGTGNGRNIVSGNVGHGIQLRDGSNKVQGNYVGLGTDGDQLLGNTGIGLFVTAGADNEIGGVLAGQGNAISGNSAAIQIGAGAHFIYGNTIGLNAARTQVRANNEGIRLTGTAKGVLIGDGTAAGANFISGNTTDGIYIDGTNVNSDTIQNNYLGVLGDLSTPAGNGTNGIVISGDANLITINNNLIINSGTNGIEVNGAFAPLTMNNTFSQNSIYNNTNKGISIVSGAQGNVVPPVINTIDANVTGTSNLFADVEVFIDAGDQGEFYVGMTTADDAGSWSMPIDRGTFPPGLGNMTAIQNSLGNSSEFSNALIVPPLAQMSFTSDPTAHANNIGVNSNITLDFDADVNLSTVHSNTTAADQVYDDNIRITGNQSGQYEGTYSLGGDNSIVIFNPSVDYKPGEKITVNINSNVLGSGGEIAEARSFSFIAASGPYEGAFLETPSGILGMADGSFDWGDYDNDGDLDVVVVGFDPSFTAEAIIYNNAGGVFTNINAGLTGVFFSSTDWGDYDNDGDLDLVVAGVDNTGTVRLTTIYQNSGGVFTDIGAGLQGVDYSSVDWGDYDNDGDLDLVVTGRFSVGPDQASSTIYQNNGGVFTDIGAGLQPLNNGSVDWGDYDADGDLDLVLTGFDANWTNRFAIIYDNNAGIFTDHLAGLPDVAWGDTDWGDYDNDGDLDLLLSGDGPVLTYTSIYNNAGGVFTDIGAGFPTTSEGSVRWGDYDGDGDLDVVLTGNDYSTGTEITNIFNNMGGGVFNDINAGLKTVYFTGLADWGDFDGDGDLDLLVAGESIFTPSSTSAILYQNTVPPFITTWQTTDTQITIPTFGAGYNYTVTWSNLTNAGVGDGSATGLTGNYTITGLTNNDTYQIVIFGNFPQIYFANGSEKDKIISVEQWGGNVWTSMNLSFYGCTNLTVPAIDAPNLSGVTSLFYMFRGATSFNQPINHWDVSTITNFGHMFRDAINFNQDLSNWNLSIAQKTFDMFSGATAFNQDIGGWNVSNVDNMSGMFFNATSFNQDISSWNVGLVENFGSMFAGATSFNNDIGSWDVSTGWEFSNMFDNASSFNQSLGGWDVGLADYLDNMLDNSGLSIANYDLTLIGWEGLPSVISGINLGAVGLFYCAGEAARTSLESTHGWTITDAGLLCVCPTADAGPDVDFCESDNRTILGAIGGGATSATWTTSGDGIFTAATSVAPSYAPGPNDIANGSVVLTITTDDPDGIGPCLAASDDMIITIETISLMDAGPDQTVCQGDPVQLSGTIIGDPVPISWFLNSADGTFDDENILTPVYTPGPNDIINGSFSLLLESSPPVCVEESDNITITISQPITAVNQTASLNVIETTLIDVTNGATIGAGDIITTTLLTQPQKGTTIINGDGSISYTALTGTVGDDTFDYEIRNQCNLFSSAQITITIINVPPVVNVPPSTIMAGGVVAINVLNNITDDNGNVDLTSLRITVQPLSGAPASLDASGNLTVDYTGLKFAGTDQLTIEICDLDGLCTTQIIFIEVEPPGVIVYNAVSPNGDSKHDFLEIENAEFFSSNQVKIMNRWGDIVFEIAGYDNDINKFTGVANKNGSGELPSGTYYYNIVLGDGSKELNGFFTLRR